MHNKYGGEISTRLDGKVYRLCLSLGALAELEAAFGDEDMIALACRFQSGKLKAADAIRVIAAGLRGAGNDISDEAVAAMRHEDGASAYVSIVVQLLAATFGSDADDEPAPNANTQHHPSHQPSKHLGHDAAAAVEAVRRDPFPGTT